MKDFLGKEVYIGDKIVFVLLVRGSQLEQGTVKNLTPKGVTVEFEDEREYGPIKTRKISRLRDQFIKVSL